MPATDLLIPARRFVRERGRFTFLKTVLLAGPSTADALPLGQLAADLTACGGRARVTRSPWGPASLRVRRDKAVAGPEAYRLSIGPGGIDITASADAGAYYAVQTLRELVAANGRTLPACVIEDSPDFARRGVYLDCSRGKVPRGETLKALVERLARWKINEFQLYVENVFTWRRHPAIGRGYSPFTPEELLAVQDHCKKHHVRLVGSLASFGHMEKILALPAYRHLAELPGFRGLPGGTTLCPGESGSIRLVEELYEEFVPLFEAEDFNVCGDEPWELGQGRSRRRARRIGVGRVYLEFLKKIHRLCTRHGKRMNAWADIVLAHPEVLGDLPKDIVMLNWDYHPQGRRIPRTQAIIDAGLDAMVCPGTNAWNSHGCRLEMGMANIARFAAEGRRCGVEGLLNTDWGDGGHRNMLAVSLHNYAWGAAHAWHGRGVMEDGFTERFCRHTFGPGIGPALAGAIRTLGRAHEALGLPYANSTLLYHSFFGPAREFLKADDPRGKAMDSVEIADLHEHGRALGALRWPAPTSAHDPFLRIIFEEFALAAQLDQAACRRVAVLKQLRQRRQPCVREFRRLIDATRQLSPELERVWLLGNKPSRLRDQLRSLRLALKDYRRLARA